MSQDPSDAAARSDDREALFFELHQLCLDNITTVGSSVQAGSVLVAARADDLVVTHVSGNVQQLLGKEPSEVLGQRISDLHPFLQICADAEWIAAHCPHAELGLSGWDHGGLQWGAYVYRAPLRPQRLGQGDSSPRESRAEQPADCLVVEFIPSGNVDEQILSKVLTELERCHSIDQLMSLCVEHMGRLVGADRVLLYQLCEDFHGVVVAEHLQDRSLHSFLGLHFPESDLPKAVRDLYLRNRFRIVADVGAAQAPILALPEQTMTPDLALSLVRSVMPVHLEYLRSMNVQGSLSVPVVIAGRLWGLLACHHGSALPLSLSLSFACTHYAASLSQRLEHLLHRRAVGGLSDVRARVGSLSQFTGVRNPTLRAVQTNAVAVCEALGSTALFGVLDGEWFTHGDLPELVFDDVVRWVGQLEFADLWTCTRLPPDFPLPSRTTGQGSALATEQGRRPAAAQPVVAGEGLLHDAETERLSGLMVVGLPRGGGGDFLAWVRPGRVRSIRWSGALEVVDNRDAASTIDSAAGEASFSLQRAFTEWTEQEAGVSPAWESADETIARDFRDRLMELRVGHMMSRLDVFEGRSETTALLLHDLGNALNGASGRCQEMEVLLGEVLQANPVHLPHGTQQSVADRTPGQQKARHWASEVRSALTDLSQALQVSVALLRQARLLGADKVDVVLGVHRLIDLVRAACRLVPLRYRPGAVSFSEDDVSPEISVFGNEQLFVRVLLNIIINALESCASAGRDAEIRFSARCSLSECHLVVQDNGLGVAHDVLPRLFQKGFSTKSTGTGLGLFGCRSIMRNCGGDVSLTSPGPGQGARVQVSFPRTRGSEKRSG